PAAAPPETAQGRPQRDPQQDPHGTGGGRAHPRIFNQMMAPMIITAPTQPTMSMSRRSRGSIFGPPQAIRPATRKKRPARPTSEASTKGSTGMAAAPPAMVKILKGMGVKAATNMIQTP